MKAMRKLVIAGIAILTLAAGTATALAASRYATPAEAVAGLTGREVQSVIEERTETGKSYGTIANEAGRLDEFKSEILEIKKDTLAARVAAGRMTQERADAILARIEMNRANCDGTGTGRGMKAAGCGMGAGFAQGGRGMGGGLRNGSCLNP